MNIHGREHRDDHAAREGDGEAAHRARADDEEDDARHDRRDVGVENRREGAAIAILESRASGRLGGEFLADTLEDDHVRVDRHAERQDKTRALTSLFG